MNKLYLAGPLFATAQRKFNAELAAELRKLGYGVFVPQDLDQVNMTQHDIFQADLVGLGWCEAVVAILDGAVLDSETCWECGFAYTKKVIVAVQTDFRAGQKGFPYNLMLSQSVDVTLQADGLPIPVLAAKIRNFLMQLAG